MDLSSEEQDRIFSQIAFDFQKNKEMEEVLETIEYMTTWGWEECLIKIIDNFILSWDFWYAFNAIKLIKSEPIRDSKYVQIIELKLRNNDKSRIEFVRSQIKDKKLQLYIENIIDDPRKILKQEQSKIVSLIESNDQKLLDIVREVFKWYVTLATDRFHTISGDLTEADLKYFSSEINQRIKSSNSIQELQFLENFLSWCDIFWLSNFINEIEKKISEINYDIEYKNAERTLEKIIDFIFFKRLKKIYKRNGDIIPELDNPLIMFLKYEIEKSNLVIVSPKIPNKNTLFKLSANKYVYSPADCNANDTKKILKKLKESLIEAYIKNYSIDGIY